MNGEDSTKALMEKTDALIARHRDTQAAQPAVSVSEGAADQAELLPTLTRKLSPDQAFELIKQSALQAAQETQAMQKSVDQDAPRIPNIDEVDPWEDNDNEGSATTQATPVLEYSNSVAESFFKTSTVSEPLTSEPDDTGQIANIDANSLAEKVAPELAQLVTELTKEVSMTVFRQMQPGLQAIIENRIRAVIEDAISQTNKPPIA